MEVKIISGYGENTFQMDDADTMSLLNNAMRFHNKIKAIDGVEDNTGIKAEKEEEIKESITAQEFVKRMQEKPHSRNDSLFGTGWKKEPEKTEEPQDMEHPDGYKGFLYIKCDKCGKEKGFCAKEKIKSYKCECGKETELVNLKPLYTKCKCGNEFMRFGKHCRYLCLCIFHSFVCLCFGFFSGLLHNLEGFFSGGFQRTLILFLKCLRLILLLLCSCKLLIDHSLSYVHHFDDRSE